MEQGDVVGQYRIERVIGFGAYGTCYYVYDTESNQYRVLKASRIQETYIRERETLTAVSGAPGFVYLFHAFSIGRDHYLVLSFEGESAKTLLERNDPARFTQKNVIRIGVRLFELIRQLHDHGFTHGDVHHGNVMFRRDSAGIINVTLIDFGASMNLSREIDENSSKQNDYGQIVQLLFVLAGEYGSRLDTFSESQKGQEGSSWDRFQEENNRWLGDLSALVDKGFDFPKVMDLFSRVIRNFDVSSRIEYMVESGLVRIT